MAQRTSSTTVAVTDAWPASRIANLRLALTHEAAAGCATGHTLPLACLVALSVSTPENASARAARLEWLLRRGNGMTQALWRRLNKRMQLMSIEEAKGA